MSHSAAPSPLRPLRPLDLSVLLLAGAEVIWILAAFWIPLFPDEMYYWEWSRHLAAGYFDHPPAIAWLIRGGTLLLGSTAIGIRLPSIICGMIAALGVQVCAGEIGGVEAKERAAGIFVALPLLSGVFILATPDAPLLAAVSWALYAVLRATRPGPAPAASLRWWLIAGALLGAGFLSKYTVVLVPAGVALAAALHKPLRQLYATSGPYLALLLAATVIVPLLAWNAGHDWISFRFQLAHGLGTPRGGSALDREVSFLAGQVALASPILLAMLAWATGKSLRDGSSPRAVLLAGVVVFAFAFFAWSASRKPVEANWPALAYPAAIVLLAAAPLERRGRRWLVAGQALGAGLIVTALLLVATPLLTLRQEPEATAQAYGWKEVAAAVAEEAAGALKDSVAVAGGGRLFFAANRYQDAAALAFYLPGQPEVFALNMGSRPNQYDLWPGFPATARAGDRLLLVIDQRGNDQTTVIGRLLPYFRAVEVGVVVERRRGASVLGAKRVWLLSGWWGRWPAPEAPAVRR
jgi:4-amino-4-deoxy-L-arabinose transferase-like glycosyltransferase